MVTDVITGLFTLCLIKDRYAQIMWVKDKCACYVTSCCRDEFWRCYLTYSEIPPHTDGIRYTREMTSHVANNGEDEWACIRIWWRWKINLLCVEIWISHPRLQWKCAPSLVRTWESSPTNCPTNLFSFYCNLGGGGNPSVNTYKLSKFSDFFSWNFSHGS